jgi:hypothetical protein
VGGGDFADHPVKGGLVKLAFGIGLLGLCFGTVQIAHHFGNRNQIAGIDLGFIFLRAA